MDGDDWCGPGGVTVVPRRTVPGRRRIDDDPPTVPLVGLRPPGVDEPPRPRRRPARHAGVLVLLLGLIAVAASGDLGRPATPAPPPIAAPAPSPAVREVDPAAAAREATAAIDRLVTGDSVGHVSVAARNLTTGQSFGYAPDTPIATASVVKLNILQTLLLQSQDAGRQPSTGARELAELMITQSDNDAASSLWEDVGGIPAIDAANDRLGPRDTHLDDHWGSTTTPASDQLALLTALAGPSPLDPASRAYARDLMTRVADDQRWGVSAAADPGTSTALKNGWTPDAAADGRWVVGSVGSVTVGGDTVLLAALTEHQPDKTTGIQLVEALSQAAARAVARPPARATSG
ncbi:beta-lactamase class A [Actinomycetospora succinea]|uniref:Beta-lactamase class A n=1 Tax=Actinomycetospora succinea TaxID=663603 RepID=A0A4R6VAB1_9PSEU|nr:serine hydrolase [Actinomycetospora succinea]TDQ58867.1 beta-lactamase class A [Actinomycetospora succinea]